jgi:diguanylate cyclase (GGDEF)-like protein
MVLALLWLRERLVRPIDILTRQYRRRKRDSSLTSLVEKRHDELGEVARVLDAATQDIEELRSQTKMLELAVDQRVQAKTRTVERELKKSEKQAWTDPLTQLGNRRILQERFAGIYDEHMRNRRDLSVAMIDVDNFKKLNDSLGHSAGDDLLRFIGELLKTSVRDTDLAIRQGGDEFVLVLPNVPASQAKAVAERVIRLFMQHASMLETRPHPSMSIGIASIYRNRPRDSAQLLELADEALYAAKSEGKAKVVLAGESDTAPTPAQAATK